MKKSCFVLIGFTLMLCLGWCATANAVSRTDVCIGDSQGLAVTFDPPGALPGEILVFKVWLDGVLIETTHVGLYSDDCYVCYWGPCDVDSSCPAESVEDETGSFQILLTECMLGGDAMYFESNGPSFDTDELEGVEWTTLGDAIAAGGAGMFSCGPQALVVDFNDIPVYEPYDEDGPIVTGPTEGKMFVNLGWRPIDSGDDPCNPVEEFECTVVIDPNLDGDGANDDFVFPAGDSQGLVTLTFTEADWAIPQSVVVEAVEDLDREGDQGYPIELRISIDNDDPIFGGGKPTPPPVVVPKAIGVVDNDVPTIVTVPLDILGILSENDPCGTETCIDVTLSHEPTADVEVILTHEFYSEFILTPPLGTADDPNKLTFTTTKDQAWVPATMTSGYNVAQEVCVKAVDDSYNGESGVEWPPSYLYFNGYSEDPRYQDEDEEDGELGRIQVFFNVQDNDCGAWGYNAADLNEDCVVDLSEAATLYSQWLLCTEPYDAGDDCDKLWVLVPEEE